MPDILIRDVPQAVLTALDLKAERLGLSRTEYLRRRIAQDSERDDRGVTVADLQRSAQVFGDLDDPEVMAGAWE